MLIYTADVLARVEEADDPLTNDEWNHPAETNDSPMTLCTVPCAVQERSMREQASLISIGAVRSTHKVYVNLPIRDGSGGAVLLDESRSLHINELDMDLEIVGVRDGGGMGEHLEIDAVELRP